MIDCKFRSEDGVCTASIELLKTVRKCFDEHDSLVERGIKDAITVANLCIKLTKAEENIALMKDDYENMIDAYSEAGERAEKAEAKVERLLQFIIKSHFCVDARLICDSSCDKCVRDYFKESEGG